MKKGKISCFMMCLYLAAAIGLTGCAAASDDGLETSPPESSESEEQTVSATAASETETAKADVSVPDQTVKVADRKWTEKLDALMEAVNEEHRSVKKFEGDFEQYVEPEPKGYLNRQPYMVPKSELEQFDGEKQYSMEQVQEDMDLLFLALQTNYGPFYYYGGREKFLQVKEDIIKECQNAEELTGEFVVNCLLDRLSFIQDAHFKVQGNALSDYQVPCFYRESAFEKTETGYRLLEDGEKEEQSKAVESVDGFEDLDRLFKRSLSGDGEIVYYPVVYQPAQTEEIRGTMTGRQIKPEDLTVHYSDGSTQRLAAEPYEPCIISGDDIISIHDNQGVPVIFARNMYNSEPKSDVNGKQFLEYAEKYRNAPVVMADLRVNGGGDIESSAKWLEIYAEHEVTANFGHIMKGSLQAYLNASRDINSDYYKSSETMLKTAGYKVLSDNYTLMYSQPDVFVDNEELLIVLTGKGTASAAEYFVDIAHNVKNTLIIGENTAGCMFGSSSGGLFELPNTQIKLDFGLSYSIFPEDPEYFKEYRGLEPDIWVPAGEAEELTMKMIERYMYE